MGVMEITPDTETKHYFDNMKHTDFKPMKISGAALWTIVLTSFCLTGCYEDYVKDYDYSGIYAAYQYDLRTFVLDETEHFDFTVALAGVLDNSRDRSVNVSLDNNLVTGDLSRFGPEGTAPFTAMEGMLGTAPVGNLCQPYVTSEVTASGITALTPLPEEYYTVRGCTGMKIAKGFHTAAATITATDAIKDDPDAFKAYYALGFRIDNADADLVPLDKSFEIIAVKCENKFFGNWYHGGKSVTYDSSGEIIGEETYNMTLPQSDTRIYTLTTVAADAVVTDKVQTGEGSLKLVFNEDGTINISSADGSLSILPGNEPSRFNGAKLLQDRKLFLNYSYSDAGTGDVTFVTDTLLFRNRVRDGINEWQDENPENYK